MNSDESLCFKGIIMRKGNKFTPQVLRKWDAENKRGEGVLNEYRPWHQVTRSDPPSEGRSHLTFCPKLKRMRHQLSDGEQKILGFSLMLPNQIDIREQFRLEREDHYNHLAQYAPKSKRLIESGTIEIAASLGIKHPQLMKDGDHEYWVCTTDFLITYQLEPHSDSYEIIAVSYKTVEDLSNKRKRNLLKIERDYWRLEKSTWLLLTPRQYNKLVGETVLRVLPWVMHPNQVSLQLRQLCSAASRRLDGKTYTQALKTLVEICEIESDIAPMVFWQAVWSGLLNVDLTISRFPSDIVRLLDDEAFWNQNPIVMRRSECL